MRIFSLLLLTVTSLLASPEGTLDEYDEYLREVRAKRDAVRVSIFNRIARDKSERAYETLVEAITCVRDPEVLEHAFKAFRHFKEQEELAAKSIEYLKGKALEAPRLTTRKVAIPALKFFKAEAHGALEEIVEDSRDPECRALAIEPLIEKIARRGDRESCEKIIDNAAPKDMERRLRVFDRFDPEITRPLFVAHLADRSTPLGWRILLIELLIEDQGSDVSELLKELLRHRDDRVKLTAIRAVDRRGEAEAMYVELLRIHKRAKNAVRIELTRVLSSIRADDPAWRKKLRTSARSWGATERMAAVYGWGEVDGDEAVDTLIELLDDRDWRVRCAVIDRMVALRYFRFVEPLIERMDVERGRLLWEVTTALEDLTGLRLGRQSGPWRRWYADEGDTFVLPTPEELAAKWAGWKASREKNGTNATFYGLPVLSENACFVIDVSGSMRLGAAGERSQSSESSRLDVVKEQVASLLDRSDENARFNFLCFSDDVRAWKKELQVMDEESRASALAFLQGQPSSGQTNIHAGLVAALEDEDVDSIFLLSDGAPSAGQITDPVALRNAIRNRNALSQVVIHTISIGRASRLLEGLAEDSGGRYLEFGMK